MDSDRDKTIRLYADHVYPGKVEFYQKYDIVLVPEKRGGCKISDANGKTFYNCHCNGGVFNLGHRNKAVIKAVTQAMETYDIGNHHLISKPKAMLGKMIAQTLPYGLNQVVYGVSGGEAIDLAIKLARGVTGREEIISAHGGYHGHTGFALATGDKKFKEKFKPVPAGFKQVMFNDIDEMEKAVGSHTAAVILETIPATMGIVTPFERYLKMVKEICEKNSSLLILDEVQTGFGRTGKFWGFENYDVKPDMIVMGKGMSGGIYPVSATVYHSLNRCPIRASRDLAQLRGQAAAKLKEPGAQGIERLQFLFETLLGIYQLAGLYFALLTHLEGTFAQHQHSHLALIRPGMVLAFSFDFVFGWAPRSCAT